MLGELALLYDAPRSASVRYVEIPYLYLQVWKNFYSFDPFLIICIQFCITTLISFSPSLSASLLFFLPLLLFLHHYSYFFLSFFFCITTLLSSSPSFSASLLLFLSLPLFFTLTLSVFVHTFGGNLRSWLRAFISLFRESSLYKRNNEKNWRNHQLFRFFT